jgi:hypothetical protein
MLPYLCSEENPGLDGNGQRKTHLRFFYFLFFLSFQRFLENSSKVNGNSSLGQTGLNRQSLQIRKMPVFPASVLTSGELRYSGEWPTLAFPRSDRHCRG